MSELTVNVAELKSAVFEGEGEILREIERELWDETRWGHIHQIIFRHKNSGQYYVFYFETSSGDGEYNTFDDGHQEYNLTEVVAEVVSTTKWVKA